MPDREPFAKNALSNALTSFILAEDARSFRNGWENKEAVALVPVFPVVPAPLLSFLHRSRRFYTDQFLHHHRAALWAPARVVKTPNDRPR